MIQTKFAIEYGARDDKFGVIKLEVRPQGTSNEGTEYLVIDWDTANLKEAYFSKTVFYSNAKKDTVNSYIESTYDLSAMSYTEKEQFKIIVGLMLDTKTNLFPTGKTIYKRNPNDWEYSPEVIEMFPILAL